jgi:hypothetical protein
MTSQSPRIYLYKITFEEVSYYYYGAHKEKKFNEYYMGTPVTHKWMWKFYTPKKQILQFFDFTDEGWIEAQEVEKRLIKPFYNTDKWCLNENVGGKVFIDLCSKGGRKAYELGIGGHARTKEQMTKDGKIGGQKTYEMGVGVHGRTEKQKVEDGKKGGQKTYELKSGVFGIPPEERSEISKKVAYQKWVCLETGFVANAGNLTQYQRKRKIDTSKRVRIE